MKKVYYLNNVVIFGSESDFDYEDIAKSQITHTAEQAKLAIFSDYAKPSFLISKDWEAEFSKFCSEFKLIEAGGGVVRNQSGNLLMIFRNGRWDLPKGKLEPGESIEDCAVREVEEECGISHLDLGDFAAHTYHIYSLDGELILKRTSWWNMSHSGLSFIFKPQIEEGITTVRWVRAEELSECLSNTYATIRDVILAQDSSTFVTIL